MDLWRPEGIYGQRLKDGNLPLQLDVSNGWVSILGKDTYDNNTFSVDFDKNTTKLETAKNIANDTYHYAAIVLDKWFQVGAKMSIGNNTNGDEEEILTSGDLCRENVTGDGSFTDDTFTEDSSGRHGTTHENIVGKDLHNIDYIMQGVERLGNKVERRLVSANQSLQCLIIHLLVVILQTDIF